MTAVSSPSARTETAMGRDWRLRLEAAQSRRTGMVADPKLPGLYWPAALYAKQEDR